MSMKKGTKARVLVGQERSGTLAEGLHAPRARLVARRWGHKMLLRAISAVVAASLVACIGSSGDGGPEGAGGVDEGGAETPWAFTSDAPEDQPAGDQSVFAGLDVMVEVLDLEHLHFTDAEYQDYIAGELAELPLGLAMLSLVEINGGSAERRVPGLQVFVEGEEAPEIRDDRPAAPWFTFQHQVRDAVRGKRTLMELRYQGSSFSIGAVPLEVEFTSPEPGETVSGDRLIVRWTGVDDEPHSFWAGCGAEEWPASAIEDHQTTVTLGEPTVEAASGRLCSPDVSADWLVRSELLPGTPFRSFRVQRSARRIRRFNVE